MNKLITVTDLAGHFGVHPETIRLWVRMNKIPCVRPSERTIRFNLAAVEKAVGRPIRPQAISGGERGGRHGKGVEHG